MKQLYLVRHAKSSWKNASLADIDRPLNNRGLTNAPEMATRLVEAGVAVDLIISSPANRALTTAHYLASKTGYEENNILLQPLLYFGGSSAMLDIIQNTPSSLQSLMLVGHNPDMTSLFNILCGYQTENMPTCAIASIHFQNTWSDVCADSGLLADYDYPKKSR